MIPSRCSFPFHSAVTSSSQACISVLIRGLELSGEPPSPAKFTSLSLSLSLSLRYSPASLWLKHDPWCVTTLYPLPLYPLVVYLYPQRAINPQVKVLPFSPINLPSWATLHRNSKVSAGRRLVYLWDDESRLVFSHNTFNVLMISLPWVK